VEVRRAELKDHMKGQEIVNDMMLQVHSGVTELERTIQLRAKPYSVFLHGPARWEDDKISNGSAGLLRLAGQDREDGGVL
jgi:hypothetical protein